MDRRGFLRSCGFAAVAAIIPVSLLRKPFSSTLDETAGESIVVEHSATGNAPFTMRFTAGADIGTGDFVALCPNSGYVFPCDQDRPAIFGIAQEPVCIGEEVIL